MEETAVIIAGTQAVAVDRTTGLITAVEEVADWGDGTTLVPGFVDLQVNGIGAVNVADAHDTDWDVLDAALVRQGVTTWCPTLVTAPLEGYHAKLLEIEWASRRSGPRPSIAGAHLEGPYITVPGAHAVKHMAPGDPAWLTTRPAIVRVVTIAPELPGALDVIEALSSRGVVVAIGHTAAEAGVVAEAAARGAQLTTHLFNAMSPLHHRTPGPVGAALTEDRLSVSLIADLEHVDARILTLALRAKGRERCVLVTDAAPAPPGESGAPRLASGVLAGSRLEMHDAVRNCVRHASWELDDAVAAASTNPARLLGLDDRGRIAVGLRADLVRLDADLRPVDVWIGGVPALVDGELV